MLTYDVSKTQGESLYLYIYDCIRRDIESGKLTADTPLPSKRSFAANLGVSNITVENAYAQLMAEGFIYSKPRKGFYVTPLSELPESPSSLQNDSLANRFKAAGALRKKSNPEQKTRVDYLSPLALFYQKNKRQDENEIVYDLTGRSSLPDSFPFSIWAKLMRENLSMKQADLLMPSPVGGVYEIRAAIANYLQDFRDMEVAPEQVIIGAGTEYLYGLIIQLLGMDKSYGLENPGYAKIKKIYESFNAACSLVEMDNCGIDMDSLEASGVQVLHTSPTHHFPLGIVTPMKRRHDLINWVAAENDRYIIEDDYDSELRLSGKPVPSLRSIDSTGRVIYMNTFTKSLASTIRISYMILPDGLLDRFNKKMSFYSCTVPSFEQYTLADFLGRGYFEKHLNRMRTRYKKVKAALLSEIKNNPQLSQGIISNADGGLHFLFHVESVLDDEYIVRKAKKLGILMAPLSRYYLDDEDKNKSSKGTFIISYSSIKEEQVAEVVRLLEETLFG